MIDKQYDDVTIAQLMMCVNRTDHRIYPYVERVPADVQCKQSGKAWNVVTKWIRQKKEYCFLLRNCVL